jgi:hypothetical protein
MKLEDWPIAIRDDVPEVECCSMVRRQEATIGGLNIPEYCGMSLSVSDPSVGHNGRTVFEAGTFGELARSIVEHAKDIHGIEIKRSGSWYESYTADGELWCGSSSVSDFKAADLDGMEGEELEHWTAHNAKMAELTYRRIGTYMVDVVEEWKP